MGENNFNQIQLKRPDFSHFDLSYDNKLSMKMGKLVPVHVQECIPGDKFRMASEAMFRMMPMIAPIMHKVDVTMHSFFVPNRLVWAGWEAFVTGGQDGDIPPAFPVFAPDEPITFAASDLGDYLGMPINMAFGDGNAFSAIPFAAYYKIWHDWYKDQNLETEPEIMLQDGIQDLTTQDALLILRSRAWQHDRFTSALPFAQKGDAVEIPIDFAGDLTVEVRRPGIDGATQPVIRASASGNLQPGTGGPSDFVGPGNGDAEFTYDAPFDDTEVYYDPSDTLYIESDGLSTTTTINDLRTSMALQKWLELNARGGSRYIESMFAHFGVRSSDKRLQRSEYLGGSKCSMSISEVLQTGQTDDAGTPQGNMAGHGIAVTGGRDFSYFVEEHGFIITICSVMPKTAYFQGVPPHFSKFDRTKYYWPMFAYLGEQEIKNKEVFYDGTASPTEQNATWGYEPRYNEYRYNPSTVHGQMRETLLHWHMARVFTSPGPALNANFIKSNPTGRIFAADGDEDTIVAHIYHKIDASRLIPKYGNPGSI